MKPTKKNLKKYIGSVIINSCLLKRIYLVVKKRRKMDSLTRILQTVEVTLRSNFLQKRKQNIRKTVESYIFPHENCALKTVETSNRICFWKTHLRGSKFQTKANKKVMTFKTSTDKSIVYMFVFRRLLWLKKIL